MHDLVELGFRILKAFRGTRVLYLGVRVYLGFRVWRGGGV